jgi:hypothetical protein
VQLSSLPVPEMSDKLRLDSAHSSRFRHSIWRSGFAMLGGQYMPTERRVLEPAEPDNSFGSMPELPSSVKPPSKLRWTIRRKAAVIEAVRGGWVPIEEVCRLYTLSVDEFLAWERDIDRFGVHGLRCTRYQIYRDTEPR